MALMMGALYDALLTAEVPPAEARKAAEEVAAYENRIASVEAKLDRLDAKVDAKFNLLAWMVGVVIAITVANFGVVLRLLSQ